MDNTLSVPVSRLAKNVNVQAECESDVFFTIDLPPFTGRHWPSVIPFSFQDGRRASSLRCRVPSAAACARGSLAPGRLTVSDRCLTGGAQVRVSEYNQLKGQLGALNRKRAGNLAVRCRTSPHRSASSAGTITNTCDGMPVRQARMCEGLFPVDHPQNCS